MICSAFGELVPLLLTSGLLMPFRNFDSKPTNIPDNSFLTRRVIALETIANSSTRFPRNHI
jgi:hypothetical protein